MNRQPLWITRWLERPHLLIAPLVLLFAALTVALAIGRGDVFTVAWIVGGLALVGATLMLGRNYWLLIPLAFTADLPAIPIAGRAVEFGELVGAACSVTFLARYALRLQPFTLFRKSHVPVLLYAGWVMFIFFLHPIGLSSAGASVGGARFYAKIVIALVAFLIIANQEIRERDCKWIIALLVLGTVLTTIKEIAVYFIPGAMDTVAPISGNEGDAYYTWHQALANVPMLVILLLVSRYPAGELFSVRRGLWLLGTFMVCVALIVASGKRSAVGAIPLYAMSAAFFRKEYRFLSIWVTGAALAVGLVIVGHGTFFHLSLTGQRALSFLPAQWDSELQMMEGGEDAFRAELRRLALKKIEKYPWVGLGYQVDLSLAQSIAAQYSAFGGDIEAEVTPAALGSAWHNTWLGYAADFGIPASVLIGVIYLSVLHRSWLTARGLPPGSLRQTLAIYILIFTFRDVLFAHVGGHSALDAYSRWWMYGALASIALAVRSPATAPPAPEPPRLRSLQSRPDRMGRPVRQPAGVQRTASF
jgi:hypothetical protein